MPPCKNGCKKGVILSLMKKRLVLLRLAMSIMAFNLLELQQPIIQMEIADHNLPKFRFENSSIQ
jgi:hypothetical protein